MALLKFHAAPGHTVNARPGHTYRVDQAIARIPQDGKPYACDENSSVGRLWLRRMAKASARKDPPLIAADDYTAKVFGQKPPKSATPATSTKKANS
jgi:hypothetical protein